jgi:hypothetical protein
VLLGTCTLLLLQVFAEKSTPLLVCSKGMSEVYQQQNIKKIIKNLQTIVVLLICNLAKFCCWCSHNTKAKKNTNHGVRVSTINEVDSFPVMD